MVGKRHKPVEIDNPAFTTDKAESWANQRRIRAVVSLNESATASLGAYGVLDRTQMAAANRFRAYWEVAHGLRLSANSMREYVDTGRRGSTAPERQIAAADELSRCEILLGQHGYRLVSQICGQGFAIREMYASRRERTTATDMLRIHLDSLAVKWRLAIYRA